MLGAVHYVFTVINSLNQCLSVVHRQEEESRAAGMRSHPESGSSVFWEVVTMALGTVGGRDSAVGAFGRALEERMCFI